MTDEERKKIKYEKRLALRNIIMDRLILGVIIVLLGLLANYLLEGYKADILKRQVEAEVLYKEKLRVISELSKVENEIVRYYFTITIDYDLGNLDSVKYYDNLFYGALIKAKTLTNSNRHLFTPSYIGVLKEIHCQYSDLLDWDYSNWEKYSDYFEFLNRIRRNTHRAELNITPLDSSLLFYEFMPTDSLKTDQAGHYIDLNYRKWLEYSKVGE